MHKKGVLLLNLGTPDHSDSYSIKEYLTEFLMDPRVIDLPALYRWVLVRLIVIPFRYKKTTAAYQKVWLDEGSPFLVNNLKLLTALQNKLGDHYQVELGMRYGNPTIKSALDKLKKCTEIKIIPLFPQYSSAATGSAIEKTLQIIAEKWNIPSISIKKDFYNQPGFIAAYTDIINNTVSKKNYDLILFSFHGLPERHLTKSHCQALCNHLDACPAISSANAYCYRAQCFATAKLIAENLNLQADQYRVAFQSRLGRTPWIKPYTDLLLSELRKKGIKNIAVVSPSFTADCLETLEEINIRMRQQWSELGGNEFIFVPCLNDHPLWVQALSDMILNEISQ